jgi:2-polyprenyl-3-methyl-5-hydroxy-6-metoxy-1,4-benzoquinol methylase
VTRTTTTTSTRAGFAAVDDDPDRGALVAVLDDQAAFPAIQRLRSTAIRLLAPAPGRQLIDAGCGIGDMTRRLAARVAPGGRV